MIAARLAGGNLFLPFFGGGFLVGDFGSTRSSSEHSEHSDFFEGILGGGLWEHSDFFWWDSFFWGVVGCVLDCKCWKKLKND